MRKIAKPHYGMLDLAKFLCALLILLYHFFSEHGSLPMILEEALSSYAIAVALFMGISGFLVFGKLGNIPTRQERWLVVRRQVWRILRIYLLWSIVYILYTIIRWNPDALSVRFLLLQLQQWIFGSTFYTIWFMPALAVGLVAAFWLTELAPAYAAGIFATLLYAIGALMLTYRCVGEMLPGFAGIAGFASVWLGGSRGWLLYALPLLLVGRAMAKYKNRHKEKSRFAWVLWLTLLLVSVTLMLAEALILRRFFGSTGIDMTILMPATVFCALGFLTSIQIPESAYLLWMRKMSVLIFVTQRIFLTVIPELFPVLAEQVLFSNNYLAFVFCVGGTILFSAGIVLLSQKAKILRLLY